MAAQGTEVAFGDLRWQEGAACRGPLGSVFFPPTTTERKHDKLAREAHAKQICSQCSVMLSCRQYAVDIREPHGVWGGLGEQERRVLL